MTDLNFNLRLNDGDARRRTAELARDSARVRDQWSGLPGDLRFANDAMLNLARVQTRLGHMRREDRQAFRIHQEFVHRHRSAAVQHARELTAAVSGSSHYARYQQLAAGGGLNAAMVSDPALQALHAQVGRLQAAQAKVTAADQQSELFKKYGVTGDFSIGGAASYWGRRAMFGTNPGSPDGAPRTLGEWGRDQAVGAVRSARTAVRRIGGMFAAFSTYKLITEGLGAYEAHAETVQTIGTRLGVTAESLGDRFGYASDRIKGVRRDFSYLLGEMRPGMLDMARLTGGLTRMKASAGAARLMGLDPSSVMGRNARMMMFGALDTTPVRLPYYNPADAMRGFVGPGSETRTINLPAYLKTMLSQGYGDRPEVFLDMLGAAQARLGRGNISVHGGDAERYVGLVSQAFGDAYRNDRGSDILGRLMAGTSGVGGGMVMQAKMNAVRSLGPMNLGTAADPMMIDPMTFRGARAAIESGRPELVEAFYREAVRLGGKGQFGEEVFQSLLGGQLNTMESTRLFRQMGKGGMPTLDALRTGNGGELSERWAAIQQQEAFNLQRVKAEMEGEVYERVGAALVPVALDFKNAAVTLSSGLADMLLGMESASDVLAGLGPLIADTMRNIEGNNTSPASPFVFEAVMGASSDNILSWALKRGAIGAAQAGDYLGQFLTGQRP